MKEAGIDMNDGKTMFDKFKAGEDLDEELAKKAGCAAKCIMEKKGVWKDGGADAAAVEAKMAEHKEMLDSIPDASETIKECSAKKGKDDCDTAYQILHCMKGKFPFQPPNA